MNENRTHYNVRYCIDCGKELNYHEWYYGACSDCIKRRAKERHWRPTQYADASGWFYADNAPRWKEYGEPKDMDNLGVAMLIEVLRAGGAYFGQRPDYDNMRPASVYDTYHSPASNKGRKRVALPNGMKRCSHCGRLIPISGPTRCEMCREKYREKQRELREQRRLSRRCIHCGKKLERGWEYTKCPHCLEISRRKRREEQHE